MKYIYIILVGLMLTGCELADVFERDEPEAGSSVSIESIRWLGDNYSGAQETAVLNGASMTCDTFDLQNAAPSDWPTKVVKVKVQSIVCLFYEKGGELVGGKFEWLRPGQRHKSLENVHNGYGGHEMPAEGVECYTCIVSVDGKYRTNLVKVDR